MGLRVDDSFKVPENFGKKKNFILQNANKKDAAPLFKFKQSKIDIDVSKPVPMPVDTLKKQPMDYMPIPNGYVPQDKKVLTPEEIEKLKLT